MRFPRIGPLFFIAVAWAGAAFAQATRPSAETSALARGWSQLASGDAAGASRVASEALEINQNSAAALTLLIDAELTKGGTTAGLRAYDRWLGSRHLDEAFVLRRIARALLVEASAVRSDAGARLQALRALASDGDAAAATRLEEASTSGGIGEARVLAEMGQERAVGTLISQLAATPGSKTGIIDALGNSGSREAVPHLMPLLTQADESNRAAAAQALGRIGAQEAAASLRKLLNDPVFLVRLKAAGALLRLNDSSGLAVLNEAAQSEHGAIRLAAAREMAFQPDSSWQSLVRSLLDDPDPAVRVDAAALLAPFDPTASADALRPLLQDENIAVREAAAGAYASAPVTDVAALRALLHNGQLGVRVQAASRILELTR